MSIYEKKTASKKEEHLWDQIKNTEYKELPEWTGFEIIPLLARMVIPIKSIIRRYMKVTVELESDYFPEKRDKVIHTYGAVCKIKFISNDNHSFTGIFTGIDHGLVRLSLAKKPDENNIVPGAAFKFLLDNVPSINFMVMASLEGQSSFNFFEHSFSNIVELPQNRVLQMLAKAFSTVSKDPTKVDVSNLFKIMPNGTKVMMPKTALKLNLVPGKQLSFNEKAHETRDDFRDIPAESILYEVYACELETSDEILLGKIVTKDKFICSEFGDANLFFRHQRFDLN